MQHLGCIIDPVLHLFTRLTPGGASRTQTEYSHKRHQFLHASLLFSTMRSFTCFTRIGGAQGISNNSQRQLHSLSKNAHQNFARGVAWNGQKRRRGVVQNLSDRSALDVR
jgi:hypothetical protein